MKKKFVVGVLLVLAIYIVFSLPCHGELVCTGPATTYFEHPLIWLLALIPLSLLALTLNEQKHKFWLKFTAVSFVVSMILVFMLPEYGSGIVSIDRELGNWFLAGLYCTVSVVYFLVQFFKKK